MDTDYTFKNQMNPRPGFGYFPIRKNNVIKTSCNYVM